MNQTFLSLLQNAIEAIDDHGEIKVTVEVVGSCAEVVIIDTGRGMSPAELSSAFDFGFTKKDGRVRLRLGLATSKRAVEEAAGTLTLESRPGEGTRARVFLPVVQD